MNLRYLKKKEGAGGLEITPLIDMVFILLIFFMVPGRCTWTACRSSRGCCRAGCAT